MFNNLKKLLSNFTAIVIASKNVRNFVHIVSSLRIDHYTKHITFLTINGYMQRICNSKMLPAQFKYEVGYVAYRVTVASIMLNFWSTMLKYNMHKTNRIWERYSLISDSKKLLDEPDVVMYYSSIKSAIKELCSEYQKGTINLNVLDAALSQHLLVYVFNSSDRVINHDYYSAYISKNTKVTGEENSFEVHQKEFNRKVINVIMALNTLLQLCNFSQAEEVCLGVIEVLYSNSPALQFKYPRAENAE